MTETPDKIQKILVVLFVWPGVWERLTSILERPAEAQYPVQTVQAV